MTEKRCATLLTRVPLSHGDFGAVVDVERVLPGDCAGALEIFRLDDVSAARAVGEGAGLLEDPAVAEPTVTKAEWAGPTVSSKYGLRREESAFLQLTR
jgi:hypothetical protein